MTRLGCEGGIIMAKRRIWTLACSLSLLALLVLPGRAVSQQPVQVTINQIDAAQFPDLTLYITVSDEKGNPIRGLDSGAFQLTEDGSRVASFDLSTVEQARPPLTLALALDISSSMRGTAIEEAKAAAAEFVAGLGADDRVALFKFGTEVTQLQDFTADKAVLQEKIAGLEAGGTTALYEAIYQAASAVAPLTGRRAFVILTDGWNDSDLPRTLAQAIEAAQAAGAPGYTLGFGSAYDTALERVAAETGGQYLKRPQASEVRDLFVQLAGQLQSQYVLTYRSAIAPDMKSHDVAVQVTTSQGTASGSRSFIAIPVATTPTPTATPSPPPTSTPTATTIPPTVIGPVTVTPVPTPTLPPGPLSTGGLAILGLALVVVGGGAVALAATRRQAAPRYCPTCGRAMDPSWRECLFCAQGLPPLGKEEPITEHGLAPEPSGLQPSAAEIAAEPVPTQFLGTKPQPMAWLVTTKGPQTGREFRLNPDETSLGRAAENDIILDDTTVSRYHAKVRREGEDFFLYDLAATNPTLVNGQAITRHLLREGDKVEIGEMVLVFKEVKQ
jgi:VWFA-related protein